MWGAIQSWNSTTGDRLKFRVIWTDFISYSAHQTASLGITSRPRCPLQQYSICVFTASKNTACCALTVSYNAPRAPCAEALLGSLCIVEQRLVVVEWPCTCV